MSVNPVRIMPDLQFSVVCEDIRREFNGKFILVGVIDAIIVPELPFRIPRLYLFNRWTSGVGDFYENVRLISPDDVSVLAKTEVRFNLESPFHTATTVSVFNGIELKYQGFYSIEVSVDDVRKLRIPINVVAAPKPNQQTAQPQPQQNVENPPQEKGGGEAES
ncbi:MAG: DUF6941 family protein [Limisphaerales bacterium]